MWTATFDHFVTPPRMEVDRIRTCEAQRAAVLQTVLLLNEPLTRKARRRDISVGCDTDRVPYAMRLNGGYSPPPTRFLKRAKC